MKIQVNFGSGGSGLSTEASPNLKELLSAINENQKAVVANIALCKAAANFEAMQAVDAPAQTEIVFE